MNFKSIFLLSLFLLVFNPGYSQSREVDSLKELVANTSIDSVKLRLLVDLSGICPEEDILLYAEPAVSLAQELINKNDKKTVSPAKKYFADALNNIGFYYNNKGDIASAIFYYKKSLTIRKEINDNRGIGECLNNLAYVFEQKGDIAGALEYYHKALESYELVKDQRGIAYALNNIGFVYQKQDDYNKALEYYKKSLLIRETIGDKYGIAQSLTNLGAIHKIQKNFDEALKIHLQSLNIQNELGDRSGISNSFNNIGYIYESKNDLGLALEYYKKSLEIREQLSEKKGMANSLNNIGRIYLLKNNYIEAKIAAIRSYQLSSQLGFPENISNASNLLASIYKKQGNYKDALDMYELYLKMHDSIHNESVRKNTAKQQLRYEYGKKAVADSVRYAEFKKVKDAEILAQQAQIEQDKIKRWALFGGLFLVFVFSIFIYNRFKITQKQKAIIEIQKRDVEFQKEIIEQKQKEIVDSINYAKRIQYTLLANDELLRSNLLSHFILFAPKDIVSGDFYWATQKDQRFYLAICDSTGHGVPGAFMSLLNISFMNEAINEKNITAPNQIFNYVRERLISSLSKEGAHDGMDGVLLCFEKNSITYAAANNSPVLIRNNNLLKLESDKMPIGFGISQQEFNLYRVEAQKGDLLYIYTDGFADQFGGPKGKKFKYNQLNDLLLRIHNSNLQSQCEALQLEFDNWKGKMEQVDDVLLVGIKIASSNYYL